MIRRSFLPIAAVLAVVTGCSTVADAGPFPPRPFALDIAQVEPCSAVSPEQQAGWGLRTGRPGTSHGGTSPGCTWSSSEGFGYNLQTFDRTASEAIAGSATLVVAVAGFGAVQSTPPAPGTGLPLCQVVLDVADDASLRAQLQVNPTMRERDRPTVAEVCNRLHDTSAQMLETLRAQQGQ